MSIPLDTIIFAFVSFICGMVYAITGFGSAILYLSMWYIFNNFGVLTVMKSLLNAENGITAMECTLSVALTILHFREMNLRFALFVFLCAIVGSAIGTILLLKFSKVLWIQQFFGLTFFASLFASYAKMKSSLPMKYDKTKLKLHGLVFITAGIFGGFLGTSGPPMIFYVLLNNFARTEVVTYNAVHYLGFNWSKLAIMVSFTNVAHGQMGTIFASSLFAMIGLSVGSKVSKYVSQGVFKDVIAGFLFCLACNSTFIAFPRLETIANYTIFCLPLFFLFGYYSRRNEHEPTEKTPLLPATKRIMALQRNAELMV